jgi:hypothetical protein
MADVISPYDHTASLILNGSIDKANIKVELLDATATFVASRTTKTSVDSAGAKEVYGNGWPQGGPTLASVTVSVTTTNDSIMDAADVDVTASGGPIGPASRALYYDATSLKPLADLLFDTPQTAGNTTAFKIVFNADGIFKLSYTLP